MSVCRVKKTSNFTVVLNSTIQDKRLSLKATGLLARVLSLPSSWDYSIGGLCSLCKENESAIKSALGELKSCGYLVVEKQLPCKTNGGKLTYEYIFYEQPPIVQEGKIQGIENLPLENQPLEVQPLEKHPLYKINTVESKYLESTEEEKTHVESGAAAIVEVLPTAAKPSRKKRGEAEYMAFLDVYNRLCYAMPQVSKLTAKRKAAIDAFLKELDLADFEQACQAMAASRWHNGDNDRQWVGNFDYIIKPEKAITLAEKAGITPAAAKQEKSDRAVIELLEREESGTSSNLSTFAHELFSI